MIGKEIDCTCGIDDNGNWSDAVFDRFGCDCVDLVLCDGCETEHPQGDLLNTECGMLVCPDCESYCLHVEHGDETYLYWEGD